MSFISNFIPSLVSLKHNKRNRKTLFEKDIIEDNGAYTKFSDTKKLSPLEFKKFQDTLKEERRKSNRRFLILYLVCILVVLATLIYFLFYFKLS